jgi:hypothetical protein
MARTQSKSGGGTRTRSSGGKKSDGSFIGALKERPYAAAGVAAGVAAASAFLWSKRSQIGEAIDTGMEKLDELKAERFGSEPTQEEIAQEALTLKETGKKSKGPRGPIAQQDIKAGIVESNQEAKAGAKAYS